jgi:hypothetical protein
MAQEIQARAGLPVRHRSKRLPESFQYVGEISQSREAWTSREFLLRPVDEILGSGFILERKPFLPFRINQPGLQNPFRKLLDRLMQKPDDIRLVEVEFRSAPAHQPFRKLLLAARQQTARETLLQLR